MGELDGLKMSRRNVQGSNYYSKDTKEDRGEFKIYLNSPQGATN